MTTQKLIKLLQEADPKGDCHVRINGECPSYVERKEGYWDGSYSYIENDDYHNGKFIQTSIGDKIDINTVALEDYIYDHKGDIDMIQLRLGHICSGGINKEKGNVFWKKVKTIIAEYEDIAQSLLEKNIFHVLKKLKKGYKIYQDEGQEIGMYNVMYYKRGKDTMRLCQGECEVILESDLFEHFIVKRDLIGWKLI